MYLHVLYLHTKSWKYKGAEYSAKRCQSCSASNCKVLIQAALHLCTHCTAFNCTALVVHFISMNCTAKCHMPYVHQGSVCRSLLHGDTHLCTIPHLKCTMYFGVEWRYSFLRCTEKCYTGYCFPMCIMLNGTKKQSFTLEEK